MAQRKAFSDPNLAQTPEGGRWVWEPDKAEDKQIRNRAERQGGKWPGRLFKGKKGGKGEVKRAAGPVSSGVSGEVQPLTLQAVPKFGGGQPKGAPQTTTRRYQSGVRVRTERGPPRTTVALRIRSVSVPAVTCSNCYTSSGRCAGLIYFCTTNMRPNCLRSQSWCRQEIPVKPRLVSRCWICLRAPRRRIR